MLSPKLLPANATAELVDADPNAVNEAAIDSETTTGSYGKLVIDLDPTYLVQEATHEAALRSPNSLSWLDKMQQATLSSTS